MTQNLALYLWHTERLTRAVARQELSEREQFVLLLFGQVIVFSTHYIGLFSGITRDWKSVVQALVLLLFTIYGLWQAFNANGGREGRDIAQRFLIVSIPLSFKFSLLSWFDFYAIGWGLTMATLRVDDVTWESTMKMFEWVWNIALTSFFFWRLSHALRVARQSGAGL